MKLKKLGMMLVFVLVAVSMVTSLVAAEDGDLFRRNISKTPEMETEKAAVYMMDFYVPAQSSAGIVAPVDNYLLADETTYLDERVYAKPLVSVYIDGHADITFYEEGFDDAIDGGIVFGAFDAYVGVSLDDGTSWRTENLSRSADLSSFNLDNGTAYPGHVHNVVHQVAEDKILAVWVSKYCQTGFPLYSIVPEDEDEYLADLEDNYGKNALYLYDLFGIAGNQGSVDYTDQGWPEVGEVPYSCVWSARGKLLAGDDPMTADVVEASHVVWTAPERLTSGVRDANLPVVDCAKGAGCAVTWQEDPEGLRPGKGLGPGEGWSGAVANAKTDIWYSYIDFDDFDIVVNDMDGDNTPDVGEAILIDEYEDLRLTDMDRPKPYVPMAIPVRITDNDQCKAVAGVNSDEGLEDPFCWIDFDYIDNYNHSNITDYLENLTGPEADADFCTNVGDWTNPGGTTLQICIAEDGRWMLGRVASTRVRMVLKPYFVDGDPTDEDGDGWPDDGSAWLSFASEESKALGYTVEEDATYDPVDIGKDMFYYSFDYAKPYNLHTNTTLDEVDDSAYIVQQGGQLNQPASCSPWFITSDFTNPDLVCNEYEFFEVQVDEITGYEYYLTEIARRFALTLNNITNITNKEINASGLSGMLIFKQGIINQGGPADIMLRRVVVPDGFDPKVDNPYAFENMECDEWVYTDGENPNYLKGLCLDPAINISGTTIVTCTTGSGNDDCAADFPVADDGSIPDDLGDKFPKVLEWRNCDGVASIDGCEDDNDLDDQTWENPYDISKGHRGFLYGDMVMMMYAWSPNWQSNAVGNDHYNLYQRRSFDGGLTWTTTPSNWCGPVDGLCGDGVTALEYYYGETIGTYVPMLWDYAPGEFEQARNLSLLHGNKVTILDPRYSPPGGLKQYSTIGTNWLTANEISFEGLPYIDDEAIDPSKYYMVYETGDNTTVDVGEAVPLDLYYSRATVFGDVYEYYDYINDTEDCNPDPDTGEIDWTACVEPRWPWLENATEDLSGEASVILNPGGTFAYNVWNQWREEIKLTVDEYGIVHEEEIIYDSDMWFRRLLWIDDETAVSTELAPLAWIIYLNSSAFSWTTDDDIVIIGSATDLDDGEIVDYVWTYYGSDGKVEVLGNDKTLQTSVKNLPGWAQTPGQPGWAKFGFKAMDSDGHWSKEVKVDVLIAEAITRIYNPMVLK